MSITKRKEKAIKIAIRTFFCDSDNRELAIYEWLASSYDSTPEHYIVWEAVENLSNFELFNVVEGLVEDILGAFNV